MPLVFSSPFSPRVQRSRLIAVVLALLFGGVGIHRFYLGRPLSGVLYLLFSWSFIPALIALVEAIHMLLMSDWEFAHRYRF